MPQGQLPGFDLSQPGDELKGFQRAIRIRRKKDYEGSYEHQTPAFELGYAAIGFDGVGVDVFELFVDAVKALLTAVWKGFAGFHHLLRTFVMSGGDVVVADIAPQAALLLPVVHLPRRCFSNPLVAHDGRQHSLAD